MEPQGHLPAVLLKVTELSETLVAEVAGVRFHPGVDADVLSQVARVSKRLCTVRTLMGLWFCVIPDEGKQHKRRDRIVSFVKTDKRQVPVYKNPSTLNKISFRYLIAQFSFREHHHPHFAYEIDLIMLNNAINASIWTSSWEKSITIFGQSE